MAEDIKVNNLIINQLSNEKFATIEKDPTQLYLTPDTSIDASEKGVAGGVATLDSNAKVPTNQIPALPYLPTSGGTVNGDISVKKGLGTIKTIMSESNGYTRLQVISEDGNWAEVDLINRVADCKLIASDTGSFFVQSKKNIVLYQGNGYKILDRDDNEILNSSMKAVPNGVASLDSDGKVPAEQLPESYTNALTMPDYTAPVSQAFGTKYQSTGGWLYVSANNGNYATGKCELYNENDSLLYTFNFHMYYDPSVLFIPVPAGYYYWPKDGNGGAGYGGTVTFFPFKK